LSVEVRVIATSNRDQTAEIASGRFREDLYYRLAVVPIIVPPLRDRSGDILALTDHFLSQATERLTRGPFVIDAAARDLLASYDWPGNVRELQNIITRACVLNQGAPIRADELRPWLRLEDETTEPANAGAENDRLPLGMTLDEIERRMIVATLEQFNGHRAKTAEALGIGLRTLSGKLRGYGYAPREKDFAST
jgi:DNA-binding NtrC family response regulator